MCLSLVKHGLRTKLLDLCLKFLHLEHKSLHLGLLLNLHLLLLLRSRLTHTHLLTDTLGDLMLTGEVRQLHHDVRRDRNTCLCHLNGLRKLSLHKCLTARLTGHDYVVLTNRQVVDNGALIRWLINHQRLLCLFTRLRLCCDAEHARIRVIGLNETQHTSS